MDSIEKLITSWIHRCNNFQNPSHTSRVAKLCHTLQLHSLFSPPDESAGSSPGRDEKENLSRMPRDLEHFPSFSFFPENTRLFNAIDSMRRHVTTSRGSQSNEWPSMPIYACIYRMNITIVQRDTKGKVWIGLDWWNTFSEIYCRKFYQHTTLGNKSYFNFRVSYWSLHLWDVMDGKTNIKLQARIKYYKIHFLSTKRCADPHRDYGIKICHIMAIGVRRVVKSLLNFLFICFLSYKTSCCDKSGAFGIAKK